MTTQNSQLNNTNQSAASTTHNIQSTQNTRINHILKKYVKEPRGIDEEIGYINLEILLVNSLKINAIKVQEVTDAFLEDKPYISIFRFTKLRLIV